MRRYWFVPIILLLGVTNVTLAAEVVEVADAGWAPVVAKLGSLIIELVSPLILMLATWAVWKLASKLGIEKNAVIDAQVRSYVKQAINYADAWAKSQAVRPSSRTKMLMAIDFVNESMATAGLKQKAANYLEKVIEAQLEWDHLDDEVEKEEDKVTE